MHRERILEMRPPIAIDASHFARPSALSSLTSAPMMDVCEYLREDSMVRTFFLRRSCVLILSVLVARSSFGTNRPERFRRLSWFIRMMPISRAGVCRC